jgi:chromosome segregation ATPase|nr:MAG TPA: Macoilin family [Caudoviricetes sp.]
MSINVKKYTKDQMAKMVEDAQAEAQELKRVNAALTEQIDQMNGEAINKANEIEKLKADADALQNKLADTEAALGRANDECAFKQEALNVMRNRKYNAEQRANYAESHPWRNLRAWLKRKLKMA